MITNDHELIAAKKRLDHVNEQSLRIRRCAVGDVPKLMGMGHLRFTDIASVFLAECELTELGWQRQEITLQMQEYLARAHGDRQGTWMPLFSGGIFWPEDPRPQDVHIVDIAHSLARINRFNGMTTQSYSVAQHSVLVASILPKHLQLFGLLHDASEAILGDVITPVKKLVSAAYSPLEERVMQAVAEKFGFLGVYSSLAAKEKVKKADMILLATEVRDLTTSGVIYRDVDELPLEEKIAVCWSAEAAEKTFLAVYEELSNGHRTAD